MKHKQQKMDKDHLQEQRKKKKIKNQLQAFNINWIKKIYIALEIELVSTPIIKKPGLLKQQT